MAAALIGLHQPAPVDAPPNPWRVVPLADRAAAINSRWGVVSEQLGAAVAAVLREVWRRAAAWAVSFLTAVLSDPPSRVEFADVIAHTVEQLVGPSR